MLRVLVLLAFVAAATACFVADVGDRIPVIGCQATAECPDGFICDAIISRCVTTAKAAADVPGLVGTASVSPQRGGFDTVFTLNFDLDGDLADDPTIQTAIGNRTESWRIDDDATDRAARHFVAVFSPDTSVPEASYDVVGAWIGVDSSSSGPVTLASFVIDAAPPSPTLVDPQLVGATVSPALGDLTVTFTAAFGLDIDVGADPEVFIDRGGSETRFALDQSRTNRSSRQWAYTLSPSTAQPDGAYAVNARVRTVDGRVVLLGSVGSFVVDGTGPVSSVAIEPALIGRTGTARLSVVVAEPLSSPPTVRFRDTDPGLILETATDTLFIFALHPTCFAGGCIPADGRYVIDAIDVVDVAGNRTTVRPADLAITVDARAPKVISLTLANRRVSEVAGFNVVDADVIVDEAIDANALTAALDDIALPCVSVGGDAHRFHCTGVISEADVEEGDRVVQVTVIDAAGNVGAATTAIVVDFTAPDIVAGSATLAIDAPAGGLSITNGRGRPGALVRVAFNGSEVLAEAPAIEAVPSDTPIDAAAAAPLAFVSTSLVGGRVVQQSHRLLSSTVDGDYIVRARLTDQVGHSQVVLVGVGFPFDAVVESPCPTLGCADVDGDGQIGFSATCAVGVDCDDSNPLVFFGATEIPGDGVRNGCDDGEDAPVNESVGIFIDPAAPPNGDGSRARPFRDFRQVAAPQSAVAFLAESTLAVGVGGPSLQVVVGGFDPVTWQRQRSHRSRVNIAPGGGTALKGLVGVSLTGFVTLTGPQLLINDVVFVGANLSDVTLVGASTEPLAQMSFGNAIVIDSDFRRSQVSLTGNATLVRSQSGPISCDVPVVNLAIINSVVDDDAGFTSLPPIRCFFGGRVTIAGSGIGRPQNSNSTVQGDAVRMVNTHMRIGAGFSTVLVATSIQLNGVTFDASAASIEGFRIDEAGLDAFTRSSRCTACSDLHVARGAEVFDGVHILPTSPLRRLGVNPIGLHPAAAADFDGDCRVAPFDIGPDQLP